MGGTSSSLVALSPPTLAFSSHHAVTLLVGESQTEFTVHEHYLTCTSEFFAAALKRAWVEGQTRTVKLPEKNPIHFAYYLDWIYTRKLPTSRYQEKSPSGAEPIVLPISYIDSYVILSHLYVLGERMLDRVFRNALLGAIIRVMRLEQSPESLAIAADARPPLEVVNIIYQGTTSISPARRLLVDWFLGFGRHYHYTSLQEKEFLVALVTAFSKKAELGLPLTDCRGDSLRYQNYVV